MLHVSSLSRASHLFLSIALSAICLLLAGQMTAQTPSFTFQGRLSDNSAAANGTYQMQFSLYDALSGGAQLGTTITNNTVTVTNGVFTVQLDFSPATPFATGADRFLEIAVRKAADPPGFTTLTPRQQLTSSPYSIRTLSANAADSLSAACVLCVTDSHISGIDGSKLTGTVADARLSSNVVLKDATQTLTNKTIDSTTNTVTADKLRTATTVVNVNSSAAPTAGQVLTATNSTTANWQTPTGPTVHFIGESYGGGIVFYVYNNGQHGLIAATADQSTGIRWYGGSFTNTRARADGVGAGLKNTAIMIANQGPVDGNPFAATVCNEYSVTVGGVTYGDWYLPSKHELNLLYLQKTIVGGFSSDFYWSSSEVANGLAWIQTFNDGFQGSSNKDFSSYVRAVRAF